MCILKLFKSVCPPSLSISQKFQFFTPGAIFKVYVGIYGYMAYNHIYLKKSPGMKKMKFSRNWQSMSTNCFKELENTYNTNGIPEGLKR